MKSISAALSLAIFANLVAAQDVSSSLSSHSQISDCWVVWKGNAYDVTSWSTKHPGGKDVYTPYCGKTGTGFETAFQGQHGSSKDSSLTTNLVLKGTVSSTAATGTGSASPSTTSSKNSAFGLFPSVTEMMAFAAIALLA